MSAPTVVVGMSVADVNRRDELTEAAVGLGASVAFLQLADPALTSELTRLADAGAETITLLGVGTDRVASAHSWLRRAAAYWWRERSGRRPEVLVATRLAAHPVELPAVAERTRPITGDEPGLTSAAWEHVTAHRHQVMVCRGPRCSARGASESHRALVLALMEQGLGDDDVLLVQTGCQFPCNQAPVVSVQPDDVWYGGVDPDVASAIVTEHLAGGRPVAEHCLPRGSRDR